MTPEISTYQNQHNLYGTGTNGMQGYFEHIRNHFGQSYFDQLVAFFTQNSSLYIDSLYLNEWHIYGNSRLGIYEANLPIACISARDANENGIFEVEEYLATTFSEHTMLFGSYQNNRGYKRYEFSNHLGNVLLTISDKKTQTCGQEITWNVEVISATDYSPFGAPLPGRTWNAEAYRFTFNGGETINEVYGKDNYVDLGERGVDTRLGKLNWSIDPRAAEYPWQSPYAYYANSPIWQIDYKGGGKDDWVEKANGEIYWDDNATSQETTKEGEKYLGKNVLVATHNRDENLNEPINTARFDLYLESNKKGPTATIYGNTVPADVNKYGTLAEGLYPAKYATYKGDGAILINNGGNLPTVKGNPNNRKNYNSDGTMKPISKHVIDEIFFHKGNFARSSLSTNTFYNGKRIEITEGCQTGGSGKGTLPLYREFIKNAVGFKGNYYLRATPVLTVPTN